MVRKADPSLDIRGSLGVVRKARLTKFLTLDGSEPGKGGRVPSPNLEHVSPPVKARRSLHSDAVFEIWDLGKERFLRTHSKLQGPLGGSQASPTVATIAVWLGVLQYIPVSRLSVKRVEWSGWHHQHKLVEK